MRLFLGLLTLVRALAADRRTTRLGEIVLLQQLNVMQEQPQGRADVDTRLGRQGRDAGLIGGRGVYDVGVTAGRLD